ncbi:MAG: hypothetical protein LBG96_14685 [Tannerella sp.]|nr:hypothetical protein [Tannerella sp.]
MIIKNIGTMSAGFTPALEPSFPAHAPAWASEADATSPKRRCHSGRLVMLLTTLSFLLCLTTFPANAASTKQQLNEEIGRAQALYDATAISLNGWDVPLGTKWVTEETAQNLAGEITVALNIYNGADLTDYDAYLISLSNAQNYFTEALNPSGLKYDYASLTAAIADAESAISPANFAVSADGLNVPGLKQWTSQANLDLFKYQINAARQVITTCGAHGTNVSDAQVKQVTINNTAGALDTYRTTTFANTLDYGYMPDYSNLTALIATARNKLMSTAISADGADVPDGASWTSQAVWDALKVAVDDAQGYIDNNSGATVFTLITNQASVDTKKNGLDGDITTFDNSVGSGNGGPLLYNYLQLNAAIADAEAALESITYADACNDISPDDLWVEAGTWNNLKNLVTYGKGLSSTYGTAATNGDVKTTNQNVIDVAVSDLVSATTAMSSAKQSGCKPDYSQLSELITTADGMLNSTPESVDGHEYSSSDFWALAADRSVLQSAIDGAREYVVNNVLAIYGNYINNQNAVDEAREELSDAYTAFLTKRNAGDKYDALDASFTGLPTQITAAQNKLDSDNDGTADVLPSSNSGVDVPYGTKWIAAYYYNSLITCLDDARDIVASPSSYTKTHITNTYNALSAAIAGASPQMGLGANPAELADEIAAAQPLMETLQNVEVSTSGDGTDVIYGKYWVTQAMKDNLTVALTNATNASAVAPPQLHASEIVPLESVLRSAITAFDPRLNTPEYAKPDVTVLTDECNNIFDIVNVLASSTNGGADVKADATWVPSSDKNALLTAINTARTASYTTHAGILEAIDNLNDALTALLALQAPGSKSAYILATPQELPDGFVGAVYNAQVVDATLPDIAFSISSGALPDGLSLDASSTGVTPTGTGKLAGKPTTAGTFGFTIKATHNSMIPVVTEALPHSVRIYDAPAVVPTIEDYQDPSLVSIVSDIVTCFPFGVPMDTTVLGTITLNNKPFGGYWSTDTTLVIPHPTGYYEYETDYTLAISGLKSKDGLLTYGYNYAFRTSNMPPNPDISRSVTLLPLPYGVTSDRLPGQYWITSNENFTFRLTVPPDMIPTITTNRLINNKAETVTGVPDPEMPETRYIFTILQIHQTLEIKVALLSVDNEIIGDGTRIWASNGKLYVETPKPGLLSVYSITGVMHTRKTITDSSAIPLPKGIYIVRLNEKTYKVVAL